MEFLTGSSTTKMSKRILPLDFARGLSIILVVWAHFDLRMDRDFCMKYLYLPHEIIYSFHIPLLFMVSATLFRKNLERYKYDFPGYLKRIALRTLVPFYTLGLLFMAIHLVTPDSIYASPTVADMIQGMFYIQSGGEILPSGVLWFLFTLFSFALAAYVLLNILTLDHRIALLIALAIKLTQPWFSGVYILGADRFVSNFIFYMAGIVLAGFIVHQRQGPNIPLLVIAPLTWLGSFALYLNTHGAIWDALAGVAASLLVLELSFMIPPREDNPLLNSMYICGKNAILIFVFHMPACVLVRKIVFAAGLSNSWLGFLTLVVAGVVVPLLIGRVLSRNQTVYGVLLGRRPA